MFGLGINKLGASRSQAIAEPETLLFSNAEEGAFLDFTPTQVYADTAGTDPAEVGEGIALTLDKSQGGELGPELVTNGDFSDGTTGWTAANTAVLSDSSGRLQVVTTSVNQGTLQTVATTSGKRYQISCTVVSATAGYNIGYGNAFAQGQVYDTGALDGSRTFTASFIGNGTAATFWFYARAAGTYIVDNISVRELPGVHALQATSTARPIFRLTSGVYNAEFDLTDDILPITLPAITGGTVALVGLSGIWIEDDWDYAGGTLDIGPTTIAGLPAGILDVVGGTCTVIILNRAFTDAERAGVVAWGKARGATAGDITT